MEGRGVAEGAGMLGIAWKLIDIASAIMLALPSITVKFR